MWRVAVVVGAAAVRVHRLLALALVEFAELNGIARYNLVAEARRVPALLSMGWDVDPLGLPMLFKGEELQALQIRLEPDTLSRMRRRVRIWGNVLQIREDKRWAA
jgi:acyl homoserine lactone synthase/acyl-homoserine lactone synthase